MDLPQDFMSLQDKIQAALIAATKTGGQISSEDLAFHRSLNPEVGTSLDEQNTRLLALSSSLLKSAASLAEIKVPVLTEIDDVDNQWRGVVDVLDSLLEKADSCLDEYTGVVKPMPTAAEQSSSSNAKKTQPAKAFRNQNILKPQLAFNPKPDNHDTTPWKPLLSSKPHATTPLELSLGTFTDEFQRTQYDYSTFLPLVLLVPFDQGGQIPNDSTESQIIKRQKRRRQSSNKKAAHWKEQMRLIKCNADNDFRYRHPYEMEILQLQHRPAVYQNAEPISYLPFDSSKATFVDTFEGVLEMLAELKKSEEIAVDLEHHDARSYVGLVSLMQISNRHKDWIVDTLKPWRQNLQVLNEVFADPNITKVFHGAYMDIVWLQRDLGLYIVGLFDTHHASRVLGYPGGSLAYLLKRFVDFDADKQYQLADWRIRPLPDEMFYYARADTHYLLYIYDHLRNELVARSDPQNPEENRIELVLQKSKETSLQRYERQIYDAKTGRGPGGWYSLLVKTPALLSNEQFAVFRAVHEWRDKIARNDDDSTNFVMGTQIIFSLAKTMPENLQSLLSVIRSCSYSAKSKAGELLGLIRDAKSTGTEGPSMMEILRPDSVGATLAIAKAQNKLPGSPNPVQSALLQVDEGPIRIEKSVFWGDTFGSSIWDSPSKSTSSKPGMTLAIPLPQLASEIFADSLMDRSLGSVELEDHPQKGQKRLETSDQEAFVVKSGMKRKSEAITELDMSGTDPNGEYDISLNDSDEEKAHQKAASKRVRKAEKKLKQAERKLEEAIREEGGKTKYDGATTEDAIVTQAETRVKIAERNLEEALRRQLEEMQGKGSATGNAATMEEQDAFDYTKAESILHGKRVENGASKTKKPFDPYAKSMDAPKGMRKLQTERPGKSFTFKS